MLRIQCIIGMSKLLCERVLFNRWGICMYSMSGGDLWVNNRIDICGMFGQMRRRILWQQYRPNRIHVFWFMYGQLLLSCRFNII